MNCTIFSEFFFYRVTLINCCVCFNVLVTIIRMVVKLLMVIVLSFHFTCQVRDLSPVINYIFTRKKKRLIILDFDDEI